MGATTGYADFPQYRDAAAGTRLKPALGSELFAGYEFEQQPLLLEFSYLDMGAHDLRRGSENLGYVEFKALNAALGYAPFKTSLLGTPLSAWAKLGYYYGETLAYLEDVDDSVGPGPGLKVKLA